MFLFLFILFLTEMFLLNDMIKRVNLKTISNYAFKYVYNIHDKQINKLSKSSTFIIFVISNYAKTSTLIKDWM